MLGLKTHVTGRKVMPGISNIAKWGLVDDINLREAIIVTLLNQYRC